MSCTKRVEEPKNGICFRKRCYESILQARIIHLNKASRRTKEWDVLEIFFLVHFASNNNPFELSSKGSRNTFNHQFDHEVKPFKYFLDNIN